MSSNKDLGEPTLPPCRVCGRRASGLHFGVITCEACKAFYKRSRGRPRPFVCRGKEPGKCVILNGKTPLCSFCRLEACLRMGMCREGINKGRCPIEKKAELLLEARGHHQEMMRQKMLNERRGVVEGQNGASAERTPDGKTSGPSAQTTSQTQNPLTMQDVQSHSNQSQSFLDQPIANDQHIFLNSNHKDESCQAQSQFVPDPDNPYGEFMNLLMTDDPLDVEQATILNVDERAYSFSGQRLMEIISWLDNVIQADIETQLYDDEETEQAVVSNEIYKTTKVIKEELMGPLKMLTHDVYTEVFNATGIDVDDYRLKPMLCVEDSSDDINNFIEFLRRLPNYADHDLNDRLRIAKGGYSSWVLLSTINLYDSEGDCLSCGQEGAVWTSEDFVGYFGPAFEGALKKTLDVFQKAELTQEEIAVLKMHAIYRDRPYMEPKGSGKKIKEQQDLINDSLIYLLESNRGKEKAKETFTEVMQAMDVVEKTTFLVTKSARQWPQKFPELNYPRIWLEMSSLEPEEELIVAVSTNLRISDS